MNTTNQSPSINEPQFLEGEVLQIDEMARICGVSKQWLQARIDQQVIRATHTNGSFYLCCSSIVRIQHVFNIEQTYDADPQLAALVADLSEEVQRLRKQLLVQAPSEP